MADTNSALRESFYRIGGQPLGEARANALETLLEAVDATGEQPLLNEVLAEIVNSFRWSEESTRHLTAFGRLLRNLDTAPEFFDSGTLFVVYWALHTNALKMLERPDVPIKSIEEFLVRMRRYYNEIGCSLHPSHQIEHGLAEQLGDHERAARALEAIHSTEPDFRYDCEPCVSHAVGDIYAEAGEYDRAFELWAPVLQDGLRCQSLPDRTLAASLLPLVELGRIDEARANHLHGYQLIRDKDEMVLPLADHVRFCALTGNEARAVEILNARARLLTLRIDPMFRLRLLESVQLTCRALAALDRGEVELPGPDGRIERSDELHDRVDAERRAICERFDLRNGNGTQSRRSEARVEFSGAHPRVLLGLKTAAEAPQVRDTPEPTALTAEDFERLLRGARAASAEFADDRLERWSRIADVAERFTLPIDPFDEAEILVASLNEVGDPDRKRALAEGAIVLFRISDREGRALALEAATIKTRSPGEPEEARAEASRLLEAAERLAETDPVHALRARTAIFTALVELDRDAGTAPDPELRRSISELGAELAAGVDHPGVSEVFVRLNIVAASIAESEEDSHAALRAAYERATAAGHSLETVVSAIWYTAALRREGRPEAALHVAETGVAAVRPGTLDPTVAAVHYAAAETAAQLRQWPRAELYAVKASHHYDRSGMSGQAAAARYTAGIAMAVQGRHEAAILVLEALLPELAEAAEDERWRIADVRSQLADSYDELGDPATGARHALEALRLMDAGLRHPDPTKYARTAHLAGVLLNRSWDEGAAVLAFNRAAQAWRDLGSLSAAANPIRAALWVEAETDHADAEAAAEAFRSLAQELRTAWHDEELAPGYRDSCRVELAETLFQHADYLEGAPAAEPLLREAFAVFGEGEIAEREIAVARRLMDFLAKADDPDGAAALAELIGKRLDPESHADWLRQIEDRLAEIRAAATA